MAASANPVDGTSTSSSLNGVSPSNDDAPGTGTPPQLDAVNSSEQGQAQNQPSLRHNPGLNVEWAADEQSNLEDMLVKYKSDSSVVRYSKIAMKLNDKTARDVALRVRWMTKKENGKRRKDENNAARKSKDRKDRVPDPSSKSPSHLAVRSNGTPFAAPVIQEDNDDGISYQAIGGVAGQLLEQNSQVFNQITSNFSALQIHDNIHLFCQARDNILKIMNNLNDTPEVLKQMPSLPAKLNEELVSSILPPSSIPVKKSS